MLKTIEFLEKLNSFAPLELSEKMVEQGGYDNSGLLVHLSENVSGVLFTLDLSDVAVKKAKALGVNTIVTHHPAIYNPVLELSSFDKKSSALTNAIKSGLNVISMHLNLDICEQGIDASLCYALGGREYKIINYIDQTHGYGREFKLNVTLNKFVSDIKKRFATKKVLCYGNKNAQINSVASFCGAGGHDAVKYVQNGGIADVIVTSDIPHHEIKEIIENEKSLIILPHYVAEEYGFNKFYERAKKEFGNLPTHYFADKRFK